jgi:predicted flap endonuclease-1-like 5' DNA nuclease
MNIEEAVVNMRLDFSLYVLGALLLIITVVPLVITIEGVGPEARNLWMVATVVLGFLSIGLGYSQRPKTKAQACESAEPLSVEPVSDTPISTEVEKSKEVTVEEAAIDEPMTSTDLVTVDDLTQVKGIGEKRAAQLKALGINSFTELANASAKNLAKKMKISSKTTKKWINSAKELAK